MRFILTISTLLICSEARIDPSRACKAACGLDHRATARDCQAVEADGDLCGHVYRESSGDILFSLTARPDLQSVTVERAVSMTQANENNCFAMCFDNILCRHRGSFCNESGVCSALFWNKQKRQAGDSYAFHTGGEGDASNQDAPVMCDSAVPEQLPGRDNGERVDPCIATCNLSIQTPDTCRWVEESSGRCSRLFWSNEEKKNVEFSPRAPRSPQLEIETHELVELLKAPSNNCQALCWSLATCRSSGHGSFCRPNGTCQGLFYQVAPRLVKSEFVACYGQGCNELTPVMCVAEVPGETQTDVNHIRPQNQVQPVVQTPSTKSTSVKPHLEVPIEHVGETNTTGKYASSHVLIHPAAVMVSLVIISLVVF